ncbi:hypothetical protein DL93DRAFT_2233059 [Clavulina sp. PMI_390]|nr:hypothetical protein DL93DRAFT_2233059 [Clavulina sp. PMI_390]
MLTVPLESVMHALSRLQQLKYLDLQLSWIRSRRLVSSLCQALAAAPIRAIRSRVDARGALKEYGVWSSSITDLVFETLEVGQPMQGIGDDFAPDPDLGDSEDVHGPEDCPEELPSLPHLRFIAGSHVALISGSILSNRLLSVCFDGGFASKHELTTLVESISAQASAGISTLRSIYLKQYINPKMVLQKFLSSLDCPTLEHIHLVLDGMDWSEPYSMVDYVVICLEAASPQIALTLPALRSLRLELYDSRIHNAPVELKYPENASSSLKTEAASRLLIWLQQASHPPFLQSIHIFSMGAASSDPPNGCRISSIAATRPFALSGKLSEGLCVDAWGVTDPVEDISLSGSQTVRARNFEPPSVIFDPTALPVVPDPDGVIRPPSYMLPRPHGQEAPSVKERFDSIVASTRARMSSSLE